MLKKYKSLGLKNKIIMPIIFTIILGVAIILVTVFTNFTNTATDLSNEILVEKGQHYSNLIGKDLESKISLADSLKVVLEDAGKFDTMNRQEIIRLLQEIIKKDDCIFGISTCWQPNAFDGRDIDYINTPLHDETGRFIPYIINDDSGLHVKALTEYNNNSYSNIKETTITEPFKYESEGQTFFMTSIVEPLIIDGRFVGTLKVDVLLKHINNLLNEVKLFDTGYVYLMSSEGKLITSLDEELIGLSLYDFVSPQVCDIIKNSIETGDVKQFVSTNINDNDKIMTTMIPMQIGKTGINWGVGVIVPKKEVMSSVMSQTYLGIGIGTIATLVVLILLFIIINGIIKEIYSLDQKLFHSSSYVSSASIQLAATSQELSDGSNEQAASIEETSASMEEAASMAQQNAENTKTASILSEKTKESANIGADKMNAMVKDMKDLQESSNQISKIIQVINDIAFQTNILALNAAVEAARAGDAGQGFAVVAEEVRNLAHKSSEAAKDTSEIIERNIELSTKGANVSSEVKQSLDDIIIEIEKVSNLVAEIAASSDEQIGGVKQINNAMTSMEQVVQKNAAAAEESAAASEELQAQSNELETVVKKLNILIEGNKKEKKTKEKNKKFEVKQNSHKDNNKEQITQNKKIDNKNNIESFDGIKALNEDNEF